MSTDIHEQHHNVATSIGSIAVYSRQVASDALPVIFLHGVYFDHHLWDYQIDAIPDRTTIAIDMPLHGRSNTQIKADWTLADCAEMLVEILDGLGIQRVIAVGHSWGSMTILRAAHRHPKRFASVVLCNMPFLKATGVQRMLFRLNHSMLGFRDFYIAQAGKALFGRISRRDDPSLLDQLTRPMSMLSSDRIKYIDRAVIMNADDASNLLFELNVKAVALKGEDDYVPTPPAHIETVTVKGGHVSPLERPDEVLDVVKSVLTELID